tara:strand:- start:341 stop:547 length:207 start_codon:yes stop_codon:yes gene_type:complete
MIVTCPHHLTLDALNHHANKNAYALRGLDGFDLHYFAKLFFESKGVYVSASQLPTENKQYYKELSKLS